MFRLIKAGRNQKHAPGDTDSLYISAEFIQHSWHGALSSAEIQLIMSSGPTNYNDIPLLKVRLLTAWENDSLKLEPSEGCLELSTLSVVFPTNNPSCLLTTGSIDERNTEERKVCHPRRVCTSCIWCLDNGHFSVFHPAGQPGKFAVTKKWIPT